MKVIEWFKRAEGHLSSVSDYMAFLDAGQETSREVQAHTYRMLEQRLTAIEALLAVSVNSDEFPVLDKAGKKELFDQFKARYTKPVEDE
jgi:hypothetical protein